MSATTTPQPQTSSYTGSAKLLTGIVLSVITFWLFAGTLGTVAQNVVADVNGNHLTPTITQDQMNLAVSITALASGLFIVLFGGLADRLGRVKVAITGNLLSILGSLLIVLASGSAALPLLLTGRALQGLSAACIMPATMALVRRYWDGAARQRAVSMWSIGSWGGSGLAALFGGFVATTFNWRAIFIASMVVSVIGILLLARTPESKGEAQQKGSFDVPGLISFMVTTLALMIVVVFGRQLGWGSPLTLVLIGVAVVGAVVFVTLERRRKQTPFIDFRIFANTTFAGATVSNFILNATIGLLIVSQQMLQLARPDRFDPWRAGLLTIGYAVTIIAFIRVGEKLLQRFGPRKPMIWGTLIVGLSAICLIPTNLLVGQYQILAVISYTLFGIGLAFYATPSTDAAISNLPPEQTGAGSGIYKMASSLGSALGAAISLTIFTSFAHGGGSFLTAILPTSGMESNAAIREAGTLTFVFNLLLVVIALISILTTVPKGRKYNAD